MPTTRTSALPITATMTTLLTRVVAQSCLPPSLPPGAPPESTSLPAPEWYAWVLLIILNSLSGIFSGLNLGLMSLTEEDLTVVISGSEDVDEVRYAKKVMPLRKSGNLLLCTLLIGNTLVNVMLAVLTDPIWRFLFGMGVVGDVFSLAVPTALIVIFGEIIPQAYCGRNALMVGAISVPLVKVFLVCLYPLTKPIAMILDRVLGREISGVFSRKELLTLIKINVAQPESNINEGDAKLLGGALTYRDRCVGDVMTQMSALFCLPEEAILDGPTILTILRKGHTRVPVYRGGDRTNIVALLFIKDIAGIGFERALPLKDVLKSFDAHLRVKTISKHTKLNRALERFERARTHLFVVTAARSGADNVSTSSTAAAEPDSLRELTDPGGTLVPREAQVAVGIATLEDVLEEVLGEEIVDETDEYIDANAAADSERSQSGRSRASRAAQARTSASAGGGDGGASPPSSGSGSTPTTPGGAGGEGGGAGLATAEESSSGTRWRAVKREQSVNKARYDTTRLLRSLGAVPGEAPGTVTLAGGGGRSSGDVEEHV